MAKYVERDISWMYFNHRVLHEASREDVPLLERLSFLGIYSNNLDEFFRVRVATLERVMELKNGKGLVAEQRRAAATLREIYRLNKLYAKEFDDIFSQVISSLEEQGVFIVNEEQLTPAQAEFVTRYYLEELNGTTNPLLLKELENLSEMEDSWIYLAVQMDYSAKYRGETVTRSDYSVICLPHGGASRFVRLPDEEGRLSVIFIDDIIRYCLPNIFAGTKYEAFRAYTFKFTKDAEMDVDSELSQSIVQRISKGLRRRKRGEALRLVYDATMPKELVLKLKKQLKLGRLSTMMAGRRYHNMKDLMQFPSAGRRELKYRRITPLLIPELSGKNSAIAAVRERDWLLHCPYHDFDMFIRLLREASLLPSVTSISISIYRLARNSKVVQALLAAARNGKRVTVMIELMARFDEASNIDWSGILQEAGVRVIFGPEGLKVHSKLLHIGSTQGDIACVSTGNFHEGNARVYTDYTLLTARPALVREVRQAFDFIERPYVEPNFKQLVVSPNHMRRWFLTSLQKEKTNAERGKEAYLLAKVNHVTDPEVVQKIYEAADAGVKIDLLVRGNCSLSMAEGAHRNNLRVVGIIDRFLEHSRIFIFCNGGAPRAFIGSADLMPRNLDSRIEVLCPVVEPNLVADLRRTVQYGLSDTARGHLVVGLESPGAHSQQASPFRSQPALYEAYATELRGEG